MATSEDMQAIMRVEEILRERGNDALADEIYALGCAVGSETIDQGDELRAADRRARESDFPPDALAWPVSIENRNLSQGWSS